MTMSSGYPFVSRRARIRTWRLRLVLWRCGFLFVFHLLHVPDLFVVTSRSRSLVPHLTVRNFVVGVDQRDILGVLVVRVGQVLVVVTRVGEVSQVAYGGVLVDLVAGRLAGGGLGRYLVRRGRTRRQGPTVDGRAHYGGRGLGLDGRPAGVRRGAGRTVRCGLLNVVRRVVN